MKTKAITVSPFVQNVLQSAFVEGNVLRLTQQLQPKQYAEVAKAIETAGGKWNRKQQAHIFERPVADVLSDVLNGGDRVVNQQQTFQTFNTPDDLADEMAVLAGVQPMEWVLEPSAGTGNLLRAAQRRGANVFAVEIQEHLTAKLKLVKAQGIDVEGRRYMPDTVVVHSDFLGFSGNMKFDVVLMNPPFSRGQDYQHILKALSFLKPGGRMAALTSRSTASSHHRDFSELTRKFAHYSNRLILEGTFKSEGTSIETLLHHIVK
ncbi:MAG TPA: class I SAM-dependent methyltransferase [Candidatus Limnocylindria bacterium]|jgi:predicted RNA methylase|nr:class I SAM-dependent methyltransferase [Candidatus Limnocylindria bacterium]